MKIIDAYWEKRNLGVDVIEIICDKDDSNNDLSIVLKKVNTPYSVVKIPVVCPTLLDVAQENGYKFVETSFTLKGNIKKIKTPEIYERFMPNIKIEKASNVLLEKSLNEIKSGKIFSTDRIALDTEYSLEIAGKRYYNWCKDELERGAVMYIAFCKDVPVAFNLSRIIDKKVSDGLVGGCFSEATNKGLGFLVVQLEVKYCNDSNVKTCLGRVSSNNPSILRLHMMYGFEIANMNYVLVKHK